MRLEFYLFLCLFFLRPLAASAYPPNDNPQFKVVKEGDKKGLYDEEDNVIIPIRYDDLGWSQGTPYVYEKVIGYRENNRWGLIGIKNKKVCQPLFRHLVPFEDKLLIAAKRKGKSRELLYGLINTKGEQTLGFRYLSLIPHQHQLVASISKDQYLAFGVINGKGQAIIGFDYPNIRPISEERYAVRNQQGGVALYNAEGEALTEFLYDSISQFQHQVAITHLRGKQGVIDYHGQEQVPNQYRQVRIMDNGSVEVLPFDQWQTYTRANKRIRQYAFEDMQAVGVNLYQVKVGSVETFVDSYGKVVVPEQWRVVRLDKNFAVLADRGKYGVLRNDATSGTRVVVPAEYDSIRIDHHYIAAGKKSTKAGTACFGWQLFDRQGKLLTTYAYQEIGPMSEQRWAVKRKDHWGYADTTGQEVIACQYLAATPFSHGRASVDFVSGQGVIDTRGDWIVKPFKRGGAKLRLRRVNDNLYIFSTEVHRYETSQYGLINSQGREIYQTNYELTDNGHSLWERNDQGRYGLISYAGRHLLDTKYDTISALQEGKIYTYEREGKYGILSWDGKVLQDLNNNFQELHAMSDDFLGVKINGKYGFTDAWGRLRIANRYDSVTHFMSNMAAVKMLGRWGYINKSERLMVQPHFDCAYPFQGKAAVVKKGNRYGMVNTQGQLVVPVVYDRIVSTPANRYLVYLNDPQRGALVGLVSEAGEPLIYPKYQSIQDLSNGYVIAGRNGKYGLLTVQGRTTIPMVHQELIHDPYNEVYLSVVHPTWQKVEVDEGEE